MPSHDNVRILSALVQKFQDWFNSEYIPQDLQRALKNDAI